MILLIRHAEKSLEGNQELTTKGLDDALNYGKKLKKQGIYFDEVISSPVKRCLQTSQKIIEGMGNLKIEIQESCLLGDPGIFVVDDVQASNVFNNCTICEIINAQIKGKVPSGFVHIKKACQPILDEITNKITANQKVLYISHDAIIMPLIAYMTRKKTIVQSEIVGYLGGYVIQKYNRSFQPTAYNGG